MDIVDKFVKILLNCNDGRKEGGTRKLIVLLIECNGSIAELQKNPCGFVVHQSWLLDDGIRVRPEHFKKSFICVQYCAGKTRVDSKRELREFYNEADPDVVLLRGMGGGIINMKQLGREILYMLGVSAKYGS